MLIIKYTQHFTLFCFADDVGMFKMVTLQTSAIYNYRNAKNAFGNLSFYL